MKRLAFSGGGYRIPFLAGCATWLHEKGYEFDQVCGTSSGALTAVAFVLGRKDILSDTLVDFRESMVFGVKPHSLLGLLRGLLFYPSLGNHKALLETVRTHITRSEWTKLYSGPAVYIGTTEEGTGRHVIWRLNDLDYDMGTKVLVASCCIRPFVTGQKVGGRTYYDGGERHHNIGHINSANLDSLVSIYTRPSYPAGKDRSNNIFGNTLEALENLVKSVSQADARLEIDRAENNDFKLAQVFMTDEIKMTTYEYNLLKMRRLFKVGLEQMEANKKQIEACRN